MDGKVDGKAYRIGAVVTYGGGRWQYRQAHTSLVGWEPPNVAGAPGRPVHAQLRARSILVFWTSAPGRVTN